MMFETIIFIAYIGILVFMSLISLLLFKKDKKMAQRNGGPKRIKEKTLLGSIALGGAIGGFLGRILFHHKTDKKYFSLTIYFSLLVEIAVLGVLVYLAFIMKGAN